MNRIVGAGFRTAITAALSILPDWLAEELRSTNYLCGVDPTFVGLHDFRDDGDGRAFRDTAHVAYPEHLMLRPRSERVTTMVLPILETPEVIIHELGHVLHELLGWPVVPEPVTAYAAENDLEAFAEAFTMAHVPGYAPWDISMERLSDYKRLIPDIAAYFTPRAA